MAGKKSNSCNNGADREDGRRVLFHQSTIVTKPFLNKQLPRSLPGIYRRGVRSPSNLATRSSSHPAGLHAAARPQNYPVIARSWALEGIVWFPPRVVHAAVLPTRKVQPSSMIVATACPESHLSVLYCHSLLGVHLRGGIKR